MRMSRHLAAIAPWFAATLVFALVACTGSSNPTATNTTSNPTVTAASDSQSGSGTGDGTLEVRVTDAPNAAISAVYVTASQVEVAGTDNGWTTVISDPSSFELLALSGVQAVLGQSDLPAGKYTQVRLSVTEVDVTIDGETVKAEVPSDKIKLVGTFTVDDGTKTFIALDFDAQSSLVDRGPKGYLFKPVIKLDVGQPGDTGQPTVDLPTKPSDLGDGKPETTPQPTTPTPQAQQPTPAPTNAPEPTATPDPLGAFFLSIESPSSDNVIVSDPQYEIAGTTTVDAFVTVNDDIVDVDANGRFTDTVNLEEGPNEIEVVASNSAGDQESKVLLIIYTPPT